MRLLDTALVEVDLEACQRVADWLASKQIPPDQEETSLEGFSREEIGDFYLFLVGICHQTSPIGMPPLQGDVAGRLRRGWDYLAGRFEELVRSDRHYLARSRWRDMTAAELSNMFCDPKYGNRLAEPERRAELVRDLATVMLRHEWHHLDDLYELAEGRVAIGSPSLVSLLAHFEAYRDPVFKKSFFLLALMQNQGLWSYSDAENLGAPVDYHEIRGHLRLGTITVVNDELRQKLMMRQVVDEFEDLAIRKAVFRAIMEISDRSGIRNPSRLHYLFWNVFRSCCQRAETHCESCPSDCPLPSRYVPLAMGSDGRGCPFRTVCQAARDPDKRRLVEHIVSSSYDFH